MTTIPIAGAKPSGEFPKASLAEATYHLARPFTPEAIEFLVVATVPQNNPSAALIVCYVNRVTAEDRLDTVVGPDRWQVWQRPLDADTLLCSLTVFGVTRQAVGQGGNRWSQEANAFKRACKLFGIGRYLYKMQPVRVSTRQLQRSGRSWLVPDALAAQLRQGYERRVKATYEPLYGPPLEHHNVIGQLGDDGEERPAHADAEDAEVAAPGESEASTSEPTSTSADTVVPEVPQQLNETLRKAIERTPYREQQARALGAFLYDERPLEQLTTAESTALVELLLSALVAGINPAMLDTALARAGVDPDRAGARERLRGWVADRARQATCAEAA